MRDPGVPEALGGLRRSCRDSGSAEGVPAIIESLESLLVTPEIMQSPDIVLAALTVLRSSGITRDALKKTLAHDREELMRPSGLLTVASALIALSACGPPAGDTPVGEPGSPLPGLTEAELARFERGREWFDYPWTPEEGLGPLYIQDRCSSCHDLPELGGTGVESLSLMTHFDSVEGCDPLADVGGPFQQERSTPLAQAAGIFREHVPERATERIREVSPLLYGLGLIEAIPEEVILSRADPDDADGDGISGRVQRTPDGRLGRLTRRADVPGIPELVAAALSSELGITNPQYPEEQTLNGTPLPPEVDPAPDPEVGEEVVAAITDFLRFLAPPAPESPPNEATRDSIQIGARLFHQAGCPVCHTPTMVTGPNEIEALNEKKIHLYSDLLLHDLGPNFQGICSGIATPTEFRTARLMGLRYRQTYSRHLTSESLERTILAHGGEAQEARDAFEKLNPEGRRLLIRFLLSL